MSAADHQLQAVSTEEVYLAKFINMLASIPQAPKLSPEEIENAPLTKELLNLVSSKVQELFARLVPLVRPAFVLEHVRASLAVKSPTNLPPPLFNVCPPSIPIDSNVNDDDAQVTLDAANDDDTIQLISDTDGVEILEHQGSNLEQLFRNEHKQDEMQNNQMKLCQLMNESHGVFKNIHDCYEYYVTCKAKIQQQLGFIGIIKEVVFFLNRPSRDVNTITHGFRSKKWLRTHMNKLGILFS